MKQAQQGVNRPQRVAGEIRKTLSQILTQETKDPRLQQVTLTECKVSRDLAIVTVYYTLIGVNQDEPAAQEAEKALEKAKGFFRSEIGKRMKLRLTPEVRFFYDTVAENASHIEALIQKALHGGS
ncbi:MAG: 30S ribosome-binding factor RbfA [Hydrogenovibrio sp.]|uniref:30S ribosome-binding factor RbfA n=1 Tax=Hydrogenovibrio TaxID=28884 RepID=UPI00036D0606|nr:MULTISPECIES: 30S ribosome-binding factor RbfA [Hydrogenovibrio]MDR9497781.1 30S ribosome-binding factor RbfA [Hydrogenovibrio sp.]